MSARKCTVAFDCETTGVEKDDYITCIASIVTTEDGNRNVRTWHADLGSPLSPAIAIEFIDYLWDLNYNKRYDIITFNGTSFDFKFIAKLVKDNPILVEKVETMALTSEDIMLDFTTEHGYFSSMQSFAIGCNIKGKSNTGAWAATTWSTGSVEEQMAVVDYCVDDVRVLCDLVDFRHTQGKIYRHTKAGKRYLWVPMSKTFRKAYECITTFTETPVVPGWFKEGHAPDIFGLWEWISQ